MWSIVSLGGEEKKIKMSAAAKDEWGTPTAVRIEVVDDGDGLVRWFWPFGKSYSVTTTAVVVVAVIANVILSSLGNVLLTRVSKQLVGLSFFLIQVVYPVTFCVCIWPLVFAKEVIKAKTFIPCIVGKIRGEMCSKGECWKWFKIYGIMAFCDTLTGVFLVLPTVYLSPILVLLLGQLVLPFNMIASWVFLARKYDKIHIFGSAVIVAGVLVDLLPDLDSWVADKYREHDTNSTDITPLGEPETNLVPLWSVMILISHVPHVLGHIFKEWHIKSEQMDSFMTTTWVATIQMPMNILLFFIVLLPLPYSDFNVSPSELGKYVDASARCIFTNLLPDETFSGNGTTSFVSSDVFCDDVFGLFTAFLITNVFQNIINIYLIKKTTTNITVIAGVASVTLSDLGFCLLPLAGVAYKNLDSHDWLSSVVIILGVLIFWSTPEKAKDSETLELNKTLYQDYELEMNEKDD